jgi:hypothetical protein
MACLSRPGGRSDVAAATTPGAGAGQVSPHLWSAWEKNLADWTDGPAVGPAGGGEAAGAALACAGLMTWLGEPPYAARLLAKVRRLSSPEGSVGGGGGGWSTAVGCALALAQARAEAAAGDLAAAEGLARGALRAAQDSLLDHRLGGGQRSGIDDNSGGGGYEQTVIAGGGASEDTANDASGPTTSSGAAASVGLCRLNQVDP